MLHNRVFEQPRCAQQMANDRNSDEQALYSAFRDIADVLLPLKQDLRVRAHAMVGAFLGFSSTSSTPPEADVSPPADADRPAPRRGPPPTRPTSRGEHPTPKDFLAQKRPNTDTERVACLAYYLTHYRATPHFKTIDINNLNGEASRRNFGNSAYAVNNAVQTGYLSSVSRGMKQLAKDGERYVDALPDRAAAKATFRSRKTKRKQGRKKS